MLRRDRQIKMQIQQVFDACLFGLSFWLAWGLRSNPTIIRKLELKAVHSFDSYVFLYLLVIFGGPIVLENMGFYDRPMLASRRSTLWVLLKGSVVTSTGIIIVIYFFNVELARAVATLFGVISFLLILIKEEILQMWLRSRFAQSQFLRRFILVGTKEETLLMREELKASPEDGILVVAELDLNTHSIDELTEMLHERSLNGVILNARHNYFEKIEAAINTCELEGVEVWLIADFFRTQISHTSFDDFRGHPVLIFRTTPDASWQGFAKQVLDIVCALAAIIILAPVILIPVAILIKLTSPGPILFRQLRAGLNGQPFTILKFRTMNTDAEAKKQELQSHNEMSGPVFKMKNDPRITKLGRFLRKFSIDELPQLFNVLRGEMSLVGPRPLPVDEVKRFDDRAHRRRLSVKPGLTCLWQISGRNQVTDFNDWVRLDLEYIDNWSLWLDLKIIWLTIPVVITGAGAR
jgi:exopolysaccharide biosynthesis polyprenyl glycosylphosphotransferase